VCVNSRHHYLRDSFGHPFTRHFAAQSRETLVRGWTIGDICVFGSCGWSVERCMWLTRWATTIYHVPGTVLVYLEPRMPWHSSLNRSQDSRNEQGASQRTYSFWVFIAHFGDGGASWWLYFWPARESERQLEMSPVLFQKRASDKEVRLLMTAFRIRWQHRTDFSGEMGRRFLRSCN